MQYSSDSMVVIYPLGEQRDRGGPLGARPLLAPKHDRVHLKHGRLPNFSCHNREAPERTLGFCDRLAHFRRCERE